MALYDDATADIPALTSWGIVVPKSSHGKAPRMTQLNGSYESTPEFH